MWTYLSFSALQRFVYPLPNASRRPLVAFLSSVASVLCLPSTEYFLLIPYLCD
ncbi:hypothetical protein HMPREF0636_1469 [Porphyromonas catoniae ATCC 51270]|uniref:Uncharacterized protein n=1 Tax=Porphyromonas catoniae ATCC 51270 TaxID=887901 RepID=Z4WSL5_9PORP|nr:hypothetical protein HMPREF0636_1469 [Porphyromonas catoniae ATCC 51270]